MTSAEQHERPAGVPLGGVGAGCVELGRDGRFRNVTVNNNRTTEDRISVAPYSFLAVRASRDGKAGVRILQETSDIPFAAAGITPRFVAAEALHWEGLYPTASYRLEDARFPLTVAWRVLAPIVPYDVDASILPVTFLLFEITNPGAVPMEADVLLNWENLSGCTRDHWPADRGSAVPLAEAVTLVRKTEDGTETASQDIVAGLAMGHFEDFTENAHGNYAVLTEIRDRQTVTVADWNPEDPGELAAFWRRYVKEGKLADHVSGSGEARCGAVCVSIDLDPGETRQVVFALSWYCPRFVVEGVDQGNGYAAKATCAADIARQALRFRPYFIQAVEHWQNRLMRSSLPKWLSRMLINANYVLSTNSILTRDGRFTLFESPAEPRAGSLDRRFHSSLGTLLFFPKLAYNELDQFAQAEPPEQPGRLYRFLGKMNTTTPSLGDEMGELMDLTAKFILMVYRDYHLTGRVADLRKLYPRLERVLSYVVTKDRDGDGLPEVAGFTTTFDRWRFYGVDSYSGSLWLAALRAFGELEQAMGHSEKAKRCVALFDKARARFEQRLWNEAQGYYYLHDNIDAEKEQNEPVPHGCISGQLAGQWYADFLGLGCLFPTDHIARALDAIYGVHETGRTVTSWPAFHMTHYACLEILHGSPERGLESVRRAYDLIYGKDGRWVFNQPLCWNLETKEPSGWGADRHMSAPAVWHVLYALQGFLLNVPDQELWIRPHLPAGVHQLRSPVFTPIAMGWLVFQETIEQGRYQQKMQISFDSPVRVQTLVLRIPPEVEEVALCVDGPDGCDAHEHAIGQTGHERLVEVRFAFPITITDPLTLRLGQMGGGSASCDSARP